jgi:hypothetical protein
MNLAFPLTGCAALAAVRGQINHDLDPTEESEMSRFATCLLASTMLIATGAVAAPALMVQPKSASIMAGGVGFGSITNTYNQAGLAATYVDEVTDLHSFAPTLHTSIFACCEWFSDSGTTAATVSYFVSASKPNSINHLVLWNEESSGIGAFNLWYGSSAGAMTTLLIRGATPFDNPLADYSGEIWQFAASPKSGWYTIEASGCPQPDPGSFSSCAIGEVAFGGAVPEPASWALMITGFGMVGWSMRHRRRETITA